MKMIDYFIPYPSTKEKMMLKKIVILIYITSSLAIAQRGKVKIVEKDLPNRVAFYALNETHTDYDVKITIKGSNIRQSKVPPRLIRVPAASKVHLKTIILVRGKTPYYNYSLFVTDSLSRRAVKKEYEKLDIPPPKIVPKKHITMYVTKNCSSCDSIVGKLNLNNYLFRVQSLDTATAIKAQLSKFLGRPAETLDSLTIPVVNLGGKLYQEIENYQQLLEALEKE